MPGPAFWDRARHADRRPLLLARNRIVRAIRAWFDQRDFVEVDPCILQRSPGNEAHLHAFSTEALATDGRSVGRLHLHTSPEFACKKLLAAGEERVVTLAHVFRNRERGPLHHPEFTMLEWYRAGSGWETVIEDSLALLRVACAAAGSDRLRRGDALVDPLGPPLRLTVAEAFERFAGIDLLATLDGPLPDRDRLAGAARAAGHRVPEDDGWSDIFSRVMVGTIEPALPRDRVALLTEYPAPEAALARLCPHDLRVAERFELYACGVELANGFGELTDPVQQRRRFEADMDLKERLYGERYPIDDDFLTALSHMPEAAGVALGLDRLVMLATGAAHIEDVLWAPVP